MSDPTASRWADTCRVFHELSSLDPDEQARRLAQLGASDPELQRAVASLLAADRSADQRLARIDDAIAGVLQRLDLHPRPAQHDPLRLVDRAVSHFRVVAPIATGGMGVVYRAEDTRLRRQVALKFPLPALSADEAVQRRFLREALAVGALDHPNLCSVLDVGVSDDGLPFIAMPLYDGESLRDRIARDGALPVERALEIARQVALGLAAAHEAGIVHRDLKPGNVMVLRDGTARVLDFGLAKLADHSVTSVGAGAVAADLEAVRRGESPAAPAQSRQRETAAPQARRRARRAALVAGVAALLAGVTFASRVPAARTAAARTAAAPGVRPEAWQLYQRGRGYEEVGRLAPAETVYRRALAIEPGFAIARARLAHVHLAATLRPVEARLATALEEATAALRTQPELADARFALGLYWQRKDAHARALEEFERARPAIDSVAELHVAIATSLRSLGRWQAALGEFERALALDPLSHAGHELAMTLVHLRRYREAARPWDRYFQVTPDAYYPMLWRAHSFVRSHGTGDSLASTLERIPHDWDTHGTATLARVTVARLRRRPADALAALAAARSAVCESGVAYHPLSLLRATVLVESGDTALARIHFDSARAMVEDSLRAHPSDPRLHIALGAAMAGLGRRDSALHVADRAMAHAPMSANVVSGAAIMASAAAVRASAGDHDGALVLLERLLGLPAGRDVSVPLLRVDPTWDPLRHDPGFARLLQRHASPAG